MDFKQWFTENAQRTGVRPQYPEGYVRSQYPPQYFPPLSAEAIFDLIASGKIPETAIRHWFASR